MSQKTEMNAGSSSEKSIPTGSPSEKSIPTRLRNPFLKSGSQAVYEVSETKKACVWRVDMPGCPDSDLDYWIDDNKVHFFSDEPAMPEYENSGRKYGGSMVFNPETYDVKKAKVKLVNGVLWVTVPKIPGKNASIDVIERLIRYQI